MLDESISYNINDKYKALALYHKCILFNYNYKVGDTLCLIGEAKYIFDKSSAYIRSYSCDTLISEAFHILGDHYKSIEIDTKCLKSIDRLNLSD